MNQMKYHTREGLNTLPANRTIAPDIGITKRACGCCGDGRMINLTRSKKEMNETTNNTTNETTTVTAPDIVCGGCASSIKKALGNLAGIERVDVDVATKTVKVEHSEAASRDSIIAALDRAGYSVQ